MQPRFLTIVTAGIILCAQAASADDCAAIYQAYTDMSEVPAYASTMTMTDGTVMKSIMIGETAYLNPDGKWVKIPLKASGRLGILKTLLPDAGKLKDCRAGVPDTIDGEPMATYSYVVPVPEEMKALVAADAQDSQTVWIGLSDGLPYKMTTSGNKLTIAYDGVAAPIP